MFARFGREEFLKERWNYKPGEHVSLITATQNGKTTMVLDLLTHTDTSWTTIPPTILVVKPSDPVVAEGLDRLGYTETATWPPPKRWFSDRPAGYGLWPRHLKDVEPDVNNAHLAKITNRSMQDLFWRGNTVTVADEVYGLCVLNMQPMLTRHWTQGAGMGSALWTATQKPSGTMQASVPGFLYNSPTHTFLGREPDERNRRRFGEIGGIDTRMVSETVRGLRRFEWLYIHRDGPMMCIIEAS